MSFFLIMDKNEYHLKMLKKNQRNLALFLKKQLEIMEEEKPKIIPYSQILENF